MPKPRVKSLPLLVFPLSVFTSCSGYIPQESETLVHVCTREQFLLVDPQWVKLTRFFSGLMYLFCWKTSPHIALCHSSPVDLFLTLAGCHGRCVFSDSFFAPVRLRFCCSRTNTNPRRTKDPNKVGQQIGFKCFWRMFHCVLCECYTYVKKTKHPSTELCTLIMFYIHIRNVSLKLTALGWLLCQTKVKDTLTQTISASYKYSWQLHPDKPASTCSAPKCYFARPEWRLQLTDFYQPFFFLKMFWSKLNYLGPNMHIQSIYICSVSWQER